MSYSPARLDGKLESEMPGDPPTPSWFTGASDVEKAEALIARYRAQSAKADAVRASEDEAITAYRNRIEEKIRETRRKPDPVTEEVKAAAHTRQPRAALSLDDEHMAAPDAPRIAKRVSRKAKPTWPRYLALGVCAMVLGTSLGYGLAKKDQLDAFFASTSEAAKTKIASLSEPLQQSAPAASSSGSSTVAPQQAAEAQTPAPGIQPAVMTEAGQQDQVPAMRLADATQNHSAATALPAPIAPGDDFVAKADSLMAQGDVASARQLYLQADGIGNAKGTLGVARSYDPKVFAQLKIAGLQPDAIKAQEWYKKASDAGVAIPQQ